MRNLTIVIGCALLIAIGAGVGLVARAKGWIDWPAMLLQSPAPDFHKTQVTGDPPITVSDGSLHSHSRNGWVRDTDTDTVITPKAANPTNGGQYDTSCGMTGAPNGMGTLNPVSAALWTDDDKLYDISPTPTQGVRVTIVHDIAGLSNPTNPNAEAQVIIDIPPIGTTTSGPPVITTVRGSFHKTEGGTGARHNRRHSRAGNVASITVVSAATNHTWTVSSDSNVWNPHFSIGFCYQ
jgi:hypothetical protein